MEAKERRIINGDDFQELIKQLSISRKKLRELTENPLVVSQANNLLRHIERSLSHIGEILRKID